MIGAARRGSPHTGVQWLVGMVPGGQVSINSWILKAGGSPRGLGAGPGRVQEGMGGDGWGRSCHGPRSLPAKD